MRNLKGITFSATVYKISTLIDGGWRLTFDVPNCDTEQVNELSKRRECVFQLGLVEQFESGNREDTDG